MQQNNYLYHTDFRHRVIKSHAVIALVEDGPSLVVMGKGTIEII